MFSRFFRRGDPVIYRMTKCSPHPGPRALHVEPARHGELYTYEVDKFWLVLDVLPDGVVEVITRKGKRRRLTTDDPRLRPARWWERWCYRDRFPQLSSSNVG